MQHGLFHRTLRLPAYGEHETTRKVPLKGFSNIAIIDSHQIYHTLEKQREGLKVDGCWVHAKKKFAELVKSVGAGVNHNSIAAEA